MDPFTNPVVLGFAALLPLLIALVKQSGWSTSANAGLALACYIAVGIVGAIATTGVPTLETIVPWVTTVTLVGKVAYDLFWSKLGGTGDASFDARLTAATSIVR